MSQYDLNSICLNGRLVRDPEQIQTNSGVNITKFGIANNQGDDVSFFDVVTFKKVAENCAKYLTKGSLVSITGRINQQRWEKDGKNFSKIEIVANTVQFISKPEKTEGQQEGGITFDKTEEVPF